MPVLVTKKLMSADCARAGCAARTANEAAARPKHAREITLARMVMESSDLIFRCLKRRSIARDQHATAEVIPGSAARREGSNEKAPRNKPQRLSHRHRVADDQVSWIADSSQFAPRGRTKVHTSVTCVGCSPPSTSRPLARSSVLSTSDTRIATLA